MKPEVLRTIISVLEPFRLYGKILVPDENEKEMMIKLSELVKQAFSPVEYDEIAQYERLIDSKQFTEIYKLSYVLLEEEIPTDDIPKRWVNRTNV